MLCLGDGESGGESGSGGKTNLSKLEDHMNEMELLHGWLERSRGDITRAGFIILVGFDFRWGGGGGECVRGGRGEKETEVDASEISSTCVLSADAHHI